MIGSSADSLFMRSPAAAFVINLPERSDRRSAMQRQLLKVGWKAEFFPAVRPDQAAGFPSIGARGCYLSHLSVLEQGLRSSADYVVVLEDDLNFTSAFVSNWSAAMSALATREWSIFYPGHPLTDLPTGLSLLDPDFGVQCTHFMAINRPALPSLIAGLETILSRPAGHPLGGPMHLDGAYSTIRAQNHKLDTYAYCPALGYQRSSRTDVGELKWFDRMMSLSRVVELARKLKANR